MFRVLIPRAYIATILLSNPGKHRWYLPTGTGLNRPWRSPGMSSTIRSLPISTVLQELPLWWL